MRLEELPSNVLSLVEKYSSDVKQQLELKLDTTALKIIDYIKINCPKSNDSKNHLADSFVITEIGNDENKTIYISSQTKGQLVHLIELGFKHRSGKMVSSRPFLRPAYDEFTPKMLEDIKLIIQNGGC